MCYSESLITVNGLWNLRSRVAERRMTVLQRNKGVGNRRSVKAGWSSSQCFIVEIIVPALQEKQLSVYRRPVFVMAAGEQEELSVG